MENDYGVDWILEKQRHPYIVSGKSIETRMRVVYEQLMKDMVADQDMDQPKKAVAIKFIEKTRGKLIKIAHDRGADPEVVEKFKYNLGMLKLKILFKQAKEFWELRYDMMFG